MTRLWNAALLAAGLAAPAALAAQQPQPTRTDSLEAVVRRLIARMDSLERVIAGLRTQGRDTTRQVDELAALRAAARQVAASADTLPAATGQAPSQARSLSRLNPEISATGDLRLQATSGAPTEDNVAVREFEFSIQSALDPFANTKIFLTYEDGALGLEEGYLYWPGLPGHIRLDAGRLRQQIGELNRYHLHALPETEYPIVYQEYFGEEGLVGDGVRLYWIAPTGGALGVQELTLEGTVGRNAVLFADGNRPSVLAHLNNFLALSPATFVQLGGTLVYGENPDAALTTTVVGGDVRFNWRPPSQAQYRSLNLRAEALYLRREIGGVTTGRVGGYAGLEYQLDRRWYVGARADWVEPVGGGTAMWAVTPHITWWQSEWAFLRAQWQHRENDNQFQVQVVWAVGPHKHETY